MLLSIRNKTRAGRSWREAPGKRPFPRGEPRAVHIRPNDWTGITFPPVPREEPMATTFEMALDHFWRAQQARTGEERTLQLASGLQLFCVAVQESVRNP